MQKYLRRAKMRIGIVSPSKMSYIEEVNSDAKSILSKLAKIISNLNHEIVITPDKGSVSEFFAQEYIKNKGKKVWEIIPLDDKEFGFKWVNADMGEIINCGTWRNQPEKFNEETDILLCVGHSVGGMFEIGYSKWFKPKPVLIINELITQKFPSEINKSLDIRYISVDKLEKELK